MLRNASHLARVACAAMITAILVGAAPAKPTKPTKPTRQPKPAVTHASVLPFIEDDYAAALKRARASMLPLFIESWAPW